MGAVDKETITVGGGVLYLDNVNVGVLKGEVTLEYMREQVGVQPNDSTGDIKKFVVREEVTLKASMAELKCANIKLALGSEESVGASQSFPDYDPSTYSPPASHSYDVLSFGGRQTTDEVALRFEHTRPGTAGKKFIVVLYQAVCKSDLSAAFGNSDVLSLNDVVFEGLVDTDRSKGDQIGFFADEVLQN